MIEWRDIEGYEGLYQVSNTGLVKSLDRIVSQSGYERLMKGRIMKPNNNTSGYLSVQLSNRKHKRFLIHRLVMIAFVGLNNTKTDVNHKDGNKHNNSLDNLEWVTKKENIDHMIKSGLSGHHKISKNISLIKDGIIYNFNSIREAQRELKINNLGRLLNEEYKQVSGYKLLK